MNRKAFRGITHLQIDRVHLALIGTCRGLSQYHTAFAEFGAVQSRFESAVSSLGSSAVNTAEARGRIQDTDYAAASASLARDSILNQASVVLQKQANQDARIVASLLS